MKKTLAVMLCLLMPAIIFARDLLSFVPSDSTVVGCLKFEKLMANARVKEMMNLADENGEMREFRAKVGEAGYDFNRIFGDICFFVKDSGGSEGGAIVSTSLPEDKMIEILKGMSQKTKVTELSHAGKNLYSFTQTTGETMVLSYLESGVMAAGPSAEAVSRIIDSKSPITGNEAMMKLVKGVDGSAAWAVMDKSREQAAAPAGQQGRQQASMIPLEDLTGGSFVLNFTGANEENISAGLKLFSRKAETAKLLAMQIQGLIAMGAMSQQMSAKQDGGSPASQIMVEVAKAIKVVPAENELSISIELTPKMLDSLKPKSKNSDTPVENPDAGNPVRQ